MKIIKAIKDFKNSLKDGWKPFFIIIVLFEVIYVILSILGYLIWIIADKIRMHKYYKKCKKRFKLIKEEKNNADQ